MSATPYPNALSPRNPPPHPDRDRSRKTKSLARHRPPPRSPASPATAHRLDRRRRPPPPTASIASVDRHRGLDRHEYPEETPGASAEALPTAHQSADTRDSPGLGLGGFGLRQVRGKLSIRYAEYISLACVGMSRQLIFDLQANCCGQNDADVKVHILNPPVAREKTRSLHLLNLLSSKFSDVIGMLKEGITEENLDVIGVLEEEGITEENLMQFREDFGFALDRATWRMNLLAKLKSEFLDMVLLLELCPDASPRARAEGTWLLKHHKRSDYDWATADGMSSKARFRELLKRIESELIGHGACPLDDLLEARRKLLGSFGRYHLESKLVETLGQVCTAIDRCTSHKITRDELTQVLQSQKAVIDNLINKRSLIGCYLINIDDPIGDDYYNDPANENALVDGIQHGSEEDENDPTEYCNYAKNENDPDEDEDDVDEMTDEEDIAGNVGYISSEEDEVGTDIHGTPEGSDRSINVDTEADGMLKSPGSSVNSPMKTESIPQESPISLSSIVSTDSELGNVLTPHRLEQLNENKGKILEFVDKEDEEKQKDEVNPQARPPSTGPTAMGIEKDTAAEDAIAVAAVVAVATGGAAATPTDEKKE